MNLEWLLKFTGVLRRTIGRRLASGELGVLLAPAGVGKTACLVHIAIEHQIEGGRVLHVSIAKAAETWNTWYRQILDILCEAPESLLTRREVEQDLRPLHFDLAYMNQPFSVARLEESMKNLADHAEFRPELVILDGLEAGRLSAALLDELRAFAARRDVSVWMSARTGKDATPEDVLSADASRFDAAMVLVPTAEGVRIEVANAGAAPSASVFLDPRTFLLRS